jgi:hypothetical protein
MSGKVVQRCKTDFLLCTSFRSNSQTFLAIFQNTQVHVLPLRIEETRFDDLLDIHSDTTTTAAAHVAGRLRRAQSMAYASCTLQAGLRLRLCHCTVSARVRTLSHQPPGLVESLHRTLYHAARETRTRNGSIRCVRSSKFPWNGGSEGMLK